MLRRTFFLVLLLLAAPLSLWADGPAAATPPKVEQPLPEKTIAPPPPTENPVPEVKEPLTKDVKEIPSSIGEADDVNYTLGPEDVIEVKVQNHPELSGRFPLNSKGVIQYEFVGDVDVNGMTKKAAEVVISKAASQYVVNPKLILKIVDYRSKSIYVIGQVGGPGKYHIRAEEIPVRDAIIEAGMPLAGSAMHRARLISPAKNGEAVIQIVDLNALLFKGDLQYNFDMKNGDQLYVPTTQEEMNYLLEKNRDNPALSDAETANPDEEVRYTLGPDDVIKITTQNHPEVSGTYTVNLEGKIQMDMVGDIAVNGLSKKELQEKINKLIGGYVDNPNISIAIVEYRSKSVYVIGQVGNPGKYYIRAEGIPVREAVIEAGLPLSGSAMHRARLISPTNKDEAEVRIVDLNALLYKGDLQYNFEMHNGDQLYVPTTQEEMDYLQVKNKDNPVFAEEAAAAAADSEEVRYTLGPDDVIRITVQNHPEVSGTYAVNLEGKIQMEVVGDISVDGMTKKELQEKLKRLISGYVDDPDISIAIQEFRSKVYYVIGEVGNPGKYYMRSDSITVREAVVEAGLPTLAAAMRKCRLITPGEEGQVVNKDVNLYDVLYGGNQEKNIEMQPGDFLYVPSTVMAKAIRVISPVAEPVGKAAATQSGVGALGTNPLPR